VGEVGASGWRSVRPSPCWILVRLANWAAAIAPCLTLIFKNIYDTVLRLLAAGARDNGKGRMLFSRSLAEDAINKAAKTFVLHGRDENRSIEIGGNKVYFGTGGAAVQTLDFDSGIYRPSTLQDLHDFTRLQDTLANVSWYTRCCVATDVPDNFDLDVNTAYALIKTRRSQRPPHSRWPNT